MSEATPNRQFTLLDRYWRAANYVSVGQIYLMDNPLLREPLKAEHVKPRLLGHWGTTPGLNFIYAHLNRIIRERDLDVLYVCGPGHGGPAMVANTWLEGTYSEVYPDITCDAAGMKQPGPDRRLRRWRRRGRDRTARRGVALEQVPESQDRRRGAADPASQRLQDRQPDRARPDG